MKEIKGYNLASREREETLKKRARELVARMTLEEKVRQTLYTAAAVERLGIPAYNWWNEALHGVARAGTATVFPQAISLAASFDPDFLGRVARVIGLEGRAKYNAQSAGGDRDIYKGLTFWSPNVNLFRDPRWGRGQETYGEDPWLSGRLGAAFVRGLQGNGGETLLAAACAKHFAVHSGPEAERHSFDARPSAYDLADSYLPAFAALVEAGVEAVMGAYNRVDGEPCCGSEHLLAEILRGQMGFEGHVVSDCGALSDFHLYHRVTEDAVESAAMAMNAGCDLNCGQTFVHLTEAVRRGLVSEERLDEAVTRLLLTRLKLGILPGSESAEYDAIPYEIVDSPEHQELNLEAARRAVVLLKNAPAADGRPLLPLDRERLTTLAVIGPNANSRAALVGNYEGTAARYQTVLAGLQDYLGDSVRIRYAEGCHLWRDRMTGLAGRAGDREAEAAAVCAAADAVVCVLGLDATIEGEEGDAGNEFGSGDKSSLDLPGRQPELLEIALASGKPVILILLSGSALIVPHDDPRLGAVLWAGYPGARGGDAIARILFGEASPGGHLPVTFYRTTEELPDFRDYSMQGRTYRYMETQALYPFGYGLSYGQFRFERLGAKQLQLPREGEELRIPLRVTNVGTRPGQVAVQLYVSSQQARAQRQLRGTQSLELAPGQVAEMSFVLCLDDFKTYDDTGRRYLPAGCHRVTVGAGQDEPRTLELRPEEPARWTLVPDEERDDE
ncbi:MAG: glycoside hydrolase family 3 N-terminal domain-containing protein [Bacillota bacterium]|nr:glycoside hydrolase family 3 N-terminal domain-containing protein [Bacillota bacterium]